MANGNVTSAVSAVKVGVVGSGYWGRNHVRVFNNLGALSHVCDTSCEALDAVCGSLDGVTATTCFEDILARPEISGVVIATPAVTHFELARAAMEAGKDVLVEKPLALSIQEGKELVEISERTGRVLMVGHILLYHPAVAALKSIMDSGELGKIQYIQSNRLSLGKVRSEENILWSFAPHDISIILHLLNEEPEEIQAFGFSHLQKGIEDVTVSILKFPSGVGAHIYVSWMNPFKEHRLVVVGDRKMAVFEDSAPENKLRVYEHHFQWVERHPVPNKGTVQNINLATVEPLTAECSHFLECVASRRAPISDGYEGLRTLTVLQRCYDHMKRGAVVAPAPTQPEKARAGDYFAHETALIDGPCVIGKGTKIWHFSHVLPEASIGENCNIGQNVLIGRGVQIGNRCKIQNNVAVYEGVILEDFVFCGPSMVFTNVYNPRCEIPRMKELRPTLVKRGATIGANATIVCGITLGEYAFIGAGAVVNRDVANYALMVGNPARRIGWMCRCGVRLKGTDEPGSIMECPACGESYIRTGDLLAPVRQAKTEIKSVPLLDLKSQYLSMKADVNGAIGRVVESQHFILGPEVQALEKEIAAYCGCEHAIGVSSGTDALLVALMTLGIGPGDEVITTPFTFFATVGTILRVGATPVFADIDPTTFNIDPGAVRKALTSKTKAVVPVHLFGQATDMDPIMEIASQHGLGVIEDAAQAIGTEYKGKKAGTLGTLGCFSFFPSKNLGAFGDGGMVVTNNASLADKARIIRNQGAKPKYYHKVIGGNFRLDALQAAILREKLPRLESWVEGRRANARFYTERLVASGLVASGKVTPPPVVWERHVFNQYVIRAENRDGLRKYLQEAGIGTEIYYPHPAHLQECVIESGYGGASLPESERACAEVLALPIFPELTGPELEYVVSKIVQFCSR
jgi:UDP-2-acetamido-3-amino-2,3-dideoxy-glucuronate N-acetyltransferase